ncbi:MAG: hypothetical protein V3T94_04425, partial [Thermoplasmata archaeon]
EKKGLGPRNARAFATSPTRKMDRMSADSHMAWELFQELSFPFIVPSAQAIAIIAEPMIPATTKNIQFDLDLELRGTTLSVP